MRTILCAALIAVVAAGAFAQDKITLQNGDVISGKVVSMIDGKVTIASPSFNKLVVAIGDVANIVTGGEVTIQTSEGAQWKRRILGVEADGFQLSGDGVDRISFELLDMINPPPAAEPKWTGSIKLTALYTSGNTRRESAGLLFDASRTTAADRITVDGIWNYGTDTAEDAVTGASVKTVTQRRAGAGFKYDYFLSDQWYALATTRALSDTLADLKVRFTAGLGVGYTVIDNGRTLLLTEAGLSSYSEDYRQAGLATEESLSARIAYRIEHAFNEDTKLTHRVEAFPSVEDSEDFYLQAVTELSTSLTDSMVASIAHTLDYDNTPADGRKKGDNRLFLTVGWSF